MGRPPLTDEDRAIRDTRIVETMRGLFGKSYLNDMTDEQCVQFFMLAKRKYNARSKQPYVALLRKVQEWGLFANRSQKSLEQIIRLKTIELFGTVTEARAAAGRVKDPTKPKPDQRTKKEIQAALRKAEEREKRWRALREGGEDPWSEIGGDTQTGLHVRQDGQGGGGLQSTQANQNKFDILVETLSLIRFLKAEMLHWAEVSRNETKRPDKNVVEMTKQLREALKDAKELFKDMQLLGGNNDDKPNSYHIENLQMLIQGVENPKGMTGFLGKLSTGLMELAQATAQVDSEIENDCNEDDQVVDVVPGGIDTNETGVCKADVDTGTSTPTFLQSGQGSES